MKKALILYFSGSGSTKNISEILLEKLLHKINTDIKEICPNFNYSILDNYDILIFGFPVFGCEIPKSFKEFIEHMPIFKNAKKGFCFATFALYQENATRNFIKFIAHKNIIINDFTGINGPASDGALVFPENLKFVYRYERNLNKKLDKITDKILKIAESKDNKIKLPAWKWYTPINRFVLYFMRKEYETLIKELKLLPERCINCKYCINHCYRGCWTEGEDKPTLDNSNCELCLKCVHNCPKNAIIFTDNMKDRKRLNKDFYAQKKKEVLEN